MVKKLIIPPDYKPLLDLKETELAIRSIKEFFQINLAFELNLIRVTAPLFVKSDTGINDNLSGIERPVSFIVPDLENAGVEIVQSLAKWKRLMLADYRFSVGEGLYTDMNALRPDEKLDNLHSIYVDQWDWEKVIAESDRNLNFLKEEVSRIYKVIKRTEKYICYQYKELSPVLPENITFVHAEDLVREYPELTAKEREKEICRQFRSVFLIGIGADLADGKPHDERAPDYDDWITPTGNGYRGLNGDILIYNPVLDDAFELSSMGIRVSPQSLRKQLELKETTDRENLYFHRRLLGNELPQSVGGGIGQSRLCMFYLRKAHIGEVQSSLWSDETREICSRNNIILL
ncbi:MAG: aspartate--ammonia ligase [Calditrichaeota bacterium]|nr:aspartate--ammonia ligase [Calditrichota bacterium]RQW01368.1 MAG: aspartate--ammonia ligase [Calditrichota bacterium]